MKKPQFTTFTGVDDFTDLDRLVEISKKLFTESLDSQKEIIEKLPNRLNFELDKSTVEKSFAYKLSRIVLNSFIENTSN